MNNFLVFLRDVKMENVQQPVKLLSKKNRVFALLENKTLVCFEQNKDAQIYDL